jgi:hypothetical protein
VYVQVFETIVRIAQETEMFGIAALPQFPARRVAALPSPAAVAAPLEAVATAKPATADIRIRRFEQSGVTEDTYSAILPVADSPLDLMRVITEACKDLPEFQVRNKDDEQFILTLTLKS